jgi:hypothetical protein
MATETYRFDGMKAGWDSTDKIILKGSTDNPEEWIDLKGHADLSEEQVADLKDHGVRLTKLDAEKAREVKQQQVDSVTEAASKRGADQMDPQAVLAAQRLQQESQKSDAEPSSGTGNGGDKSGSGDSSGDKSKSGGTTASGGKS